MKSKTNYKVLYILTGILRKALRILRYHYITAENNRLAKSYSMKNKNKVQKLSKQQLAEYHNKWKVLSKNVDEIYLENAFEFSGKFDVNIMPSDIYFNIVEPILNNVVFAKSYEDKARIDWINGSDDVPFIFVRNINGVYYDQKQQVLKRDSICLSELLKDEQVVVVKKSIEAHGGSGVLIFDKEDDGSFKNSDTETLTLDFLEQRFEQDFLIQMYVTQHEFYNKLNPSSLNTFRVLTYRSVKDDQIHIAYSFLRIGGEGSRLDNVKQGGIAVCIKPDGCFVEYGCRKKSQKVYCIKGCKPFSEIGCLYKIDDVWAKAKEAASKQLYCRLVGFDIAVDENGKVLHIETNTSDIGIEGVQYTYGPLFHEFTDEIIEYCALKLQSKSIYSLMDS